MTLIFRQMIKDIEILLEKDSSRTIGDRLEGEKDVLNELSEQDAKLEDMILKTKEKIKLSKKRLDELGIENKRTEKDRYI